MISTLEKHAQPRLYIYLCVPTQTAPSITKLFCQDVLLRPTSPQKSRFITQASPAHEKTCWLPCCSIKSDPTSIKHPHLLLPNSESCSKMAANTPFDEVLSEFRESLVKKQKDPDSFKDYTAQRFIADLNTMEKGQRNKKMMRGLIKIQSYIHGLEQFSEVIGIFVQAKPEILACIWASLNSLVFMISLLIIRTCLGSDPTFAPGTWFYNSDVMLQTNFYSLQCVCAIACKHIHDGF